VAESGEQALVSLRRQLECIPALLLVRLRSLGDSILTLPLLDALHLWRPELHLDVLTERPFAPVFARHPAVREVLIVERKDACRWAKARVVVEIARRRYPAVLNLHGGTTSLLYSVASLAPLRIGHQHYRMSWAYNFLIPSAAVVWRKERLHTVEHQLSLMRLLNLPIPDSPSATLHLEEAACERVRERLHRAGIPPRGYFLIHPTATLRTKQWQEEKFARVADYLSEKHGASVILTSAPSESEVLREVAKHASRTHHYWPDLGLEELFALIRGVRLFIGNDSGPTHAAAALVRPIVVVWGSSNFLAWHPWGTDYEAVRSDLPCIPCPGYSCAEFGIPKCIQEIPVDRVIAACERMLARSRSREAPEDSIGTSQTQG
jgi:heptosyltransferase III